MIEAVGFFQRFFAEHPQEVMVKFDHVPGTEYLMRINEELRTEKYFMQARISDGSAVGGYWSIWYLEEGMLYVYKVVKGGSLAKPVTYIHVKKEIEND